MQAAPISKNQSFTTLENKSVNGALTFKIPPPSTTLADDRGQASGTLVLHSDGTFTYTPPANYYGQVGFQFILTDGLNAPTGPYTATINITPVNDPVIYLPILFHQ